MDGNAFHTAVFEIDSSGLLSEKKVMRMRKSKWKQESYAAEERDLSRKSPERRKGTFAGGFLAGILLTVAAGIAVCMIVPGARNAMSPYETVLDQDTENKIEELSAYIQGAYYEEVATEELQEGLYRGLYDNLDEYSRYYTAEEYEELYENTLSGTYCGIGALLQQDMDTMTVTAAHVYEGSPAQEAGLQDGDIISTVDGYDAFSMELSELVNYIKGEENTTVHVTVYREGEQLEFDIVRRTLDLPVVSSEMLTEDTGYLDITEFTESGVDQFREALDSLQEQGMESLIIDLRDNPGGVLESVCAMLDEVLPEGLLVYTEDRYGNRKEYEAEDDEYLDLPMVVLVNENSASASEIFAGAVQDGEAGTILGTTTYGKGVVQSIRRLEDGSAFKLTTHRYFTPGGTCIQDIGITPDVELEYQFLGGEEDAYDVSLDNQIQEALGILKESK